MFGEPLPVPAQCCRQGCTSLSTVYIGLEMLAAPETVPAVASIGIALCDAHGKEATAADFLGREQTTMIARAFLANGKQPPDFSLTVLHLVPIGVPFDMAYLGRDKNGVRSRAH